MKLASYIWTTLYNILVVVIAMFLFTVAKSDFETVVLAVLLIMYTYQTSSHTMLARTLFEEEMLRFQQYSNLARLLGDKGIDSEETQGEVKTFRELLSKGMIRIYINGAFVLVIDAIAIWKLVSTLFLK